jgi:hypothetical protein
MGVQQREATISALVAAAGVVVLVGAFMAGRAQSREAQTAETLAIEAESKAFCGDLGFRSGSELYIRCINGLTDIRQRARERLEELSASLL